MEAGFVSQQTGRGHPRPPSSSFPAQPWPAPSARGPSDCHQLPSTYVLRPGPRRSQLCTRDYAWQWMRRRVRQIRRQRRERGVHVYVIELNSYYDRGDTLQWVPKVLVSGIIYCFLLWQNQSINQRLLGIDNRGYVAQ